MEMPTPLTMLNSRSSLARQWLEGVRASHLAREGSVAVHGSFYSAKGCSDLSGDGQEPL